MSVYCTHLSVGGPRGNQLFKQESEHKNALLGTNVERPHLAQQRQRETSVTVKTNPPVNYSSQYLSEEIILMRTKLPACLRGPKV